MKWSSRRGSCVSAIQRGLGSFLPAVLILLSSSFLFVRGSLAQTESASVSGTIVDRQGGLVPEVEVTIVNTDTNEKYQTKTNQAGVYNLPNLKPGHYHIVVTKAGFKQVDLREVTLNIQDSVNRNFTLDVGGVSETVIVNAGDRININTTDASVSTVVDQTYVKNMPLNGRSFQDLILLTPGVVTQTPQISGVGSTGLGETGEFSVNGQRAESNYYTVDGVSANVGTSVGQGMTTAAGASGSLPGASALGTTQALVSVDDLQEFRVQSSTYSAEYGRNPGGQFAFTTKSGTNQWHGTAYDYLRNDYFDANDWFNDYFRAVNPTLTKPATRQNDFGGTLGGPIRIPGLYNGKDKTFFFVSYEGLRLTQPRPASTNYVPDATLRANTPAPLNQVLNAFPVPNGPEVLVPCDPATDPTCPPSGQKQDGLAQYTESWSDPSSLNSTSVRFDHVVNDKLRFFFRFADTSSNSTARQTGFFPPSMTKISKYVMRTYTAGFNNVFTNKLNNEFRLNYSSNEAAGHYNIETFGGSTPVNLQQLAGLTPGSLPEVVIFDDGHFLVLGQTQQSGVQSQWNFVDALNLSLGRHQFKFGVDYRRLAPVAKPYSPFVEYVYFGESSVEGNSPLFTFAQAVAPAYPLYKNFSAFAQDDWKVAPRLSLSLGLRWDVNPAPGVTRGLRPYALQGDSADTFSFAPQGTPLWRTTWYNVAPRLGAAYLLRNTPGRETVLRGGGGVFFDTGQQLGSLGFSGPGFTANGFSSGPFPGSVAIPTIVNPPVPPYGIVVYSYGRHLQLPYTLQWNASVEQALGKSQTLTLSYVGSHAGRLLKTPLFQSTNNPNATQFFVVQNGLTSDYDSLQLQFRRKFTRGLTALGSYTWSHCMDYGSQNYLFAYQRGNCDFDVRHNLSSAFSYDLPNVGRNGFLKAMLHHWGIDDRFTARSGFPVTLNGSSFPRADGQLFNAGLDLVPSQPIYLYGSNCDSVLQAMGDLQPGQGCPGGRAINPSAFAAPPTDPSTGAPLRQGTAPRNFARGFRAWQMDLAVRREFPIYENLKLQFRVEAFNVFNHPNFGTINGNLCSGTGCTFGQATATLASSLGVLSPLYQMGGPRSMQFALKLTF